MFKNKLSKSTKKISDKYKVCLIGDFNVGKNSLIWRFVDRQFSDKYLSTVGVKISRKNVELLQNSERKIIQLLIWDIEEQTKFNGITASYLQGAKASIIVADVTRQETLDNLKTHINLFLSINPTGIVIVALNKSNLLPYKQSAVILEQYRFCHLPNVINTYLTCTKTGKNVDEMFRELAENLVGF